MEYYWDSFISEHGDELADLSLRETLEKYHNWLEAKGVIGGPKAAESGNAASMHPAILVSWTESERGWGQRPDGVSLHPTKDLAEEYIKEYWARQPPRDKNGNPPDCYVRPESARTMVMVDNQLYDEITHSPKKVKRMGDRQLKEFRDKKRVVTKQDVG